MKRIKYYINNAVNTGTEEKPEWTDNLFLKDVPYSETNEEIARREAYNGEYTVEDDGVPEPAPADDDEYADMASAIREGVNGI
jgi:hypothetical protein